MDCLLIRLRCIALVTVATAGLIAVLTLLVPTLRQNPSGPADSITRGCTVALLIGVTWGWAAVQAGILDAWRRAAAGRAAATRVTASGAAVSGVRRLVLTACGVALAGIGTGGLLPTAHAETAHAQTAAPVAERAHVHPARSAVVVQTGDCLWSIAASEVQPGAGPMTIAARWRAVYTANRDVIGADPDLIQPGQRLDLPR